MDTSMDDLKGYDYVGGDFSIVYLIIILILLTVVLGFYFLVDIPNRNTNIHYVRNRRQRIDMIGVQNPFTFEPDMNGASIEGVRCHYSSSKDCQIILIWGMSLFDFLIFFNNSLDEMNHIINSSSCMNFPGSGYMGRISVKANEKRSFVFRPPENFEERRLTVPACEGSPRFSLIALMLLLSDSDVPAETMIALATCMHLSDIRRISAPCVLGKFTKPRSGAIGLLRKTYVSAAETINENGEMVHLCTVCYDKPISIVLLPCRHACVCITCFNLSENCPVCRKRVISYFEL